MAGEFLPSYLPYLLQTADQLLSARFHRVLREQGIEVSEWRLLAVLLDEGRLTVGALAARCLLPQPTTTHAVARLEQRGDVVRGTGAADGRHRVVSLTPAGRRRAARLTRQAEQALAETLAENGVAPPADLTESLRLLVARLGAPGGEPD
jgi:DNA-binding MarR family transcriptional regulator